MKKFLVCLCVILLSGVCSGNALADNIGGRFGVTGRIGFIIPADSENVASGTVVDTDASFIGGGGFIFGIDRNFAAELDITRTEFGASKGFNGDFGTTNITLGVQYRFLNMPMPKLVPYVGGGVDILVNDFTRSDGTQSDVDTVAGVHLAGGVDYFIMKQLALTGEIKGVISPNADIIDKSSGHKQGDFDPSSVSVTFGVRYFFN